VAINTRAGRLLVELFKVIQRLIWERQSGRASMSGRILNVLLAQAMLALPAFAPSAFAADTSASGKAIIQSVPPGAAAGVPVNPATPPLNLSDPQRKRIAEVLLTTHTGVSLELKQNAAAKTFEPKLDETIPKGLDAEAFPQPLIAEIPATKRYTYLKLKDQILIIDPMTRKIVDMFPDTKS
jgi:hypothetical protein